MVATRMREEIKVGQLAIRFLVDAEASGGSVTMFEFDVPAGAKVAAGHSHDGYDETIYGLDGVLTWTVEGVPVDVGPGEALLIPRGAVHQFDYTHDIDARALAVVTPGLLGPDGAGAPRAVVPRSGTPLSARGAATEDGR